MNYKKNFRVLIIVHLAGIILSGIILLALGSDERFIMKGIMAGLAVSLAIQFLLYGIKPGLFADKINKHPDLH